MLEKDIQAKILQICRSKKSIFALKVNGGMFGMTGAADLVLCIQGKFAAIEVKTATGRISKMQIHQRDKMISAGCRYKLARSVEEAVEFIEGIENEE